MATLRKDIPLTAGCAAVWHALSDFGQVHTRVAPGFLTALEMVDGDRVVTFFNGMVARERLVTVDDETCRLVYAVVEGRASHFNASVQVFPEGDGSRLVWTIDLLPNSDRRDDGEGGRHHEVNPVDGVTAASPVEFRGV